MLELDYLLERYLSDHYEAADAVERALFRQLLTAQDPELQSWLLHGLAHPDSAYSCLIAKIRGL